MIHCMRFTRAYGSFYSVPLLTLFVSLIGYMSLLLVEVVAYYV